MLSVSYTHLGWYGDGVDGDIADALRAGEQDISDFVSGRTAFYFGPLEYIPLVEEANPQPDYHVQGIPVPGEMCIRDRQQARNSAGRRKG